MAESLIQKSGGGAASDECSAGKAQVLAGYTAVTKDSDDEPVAGTMPNRGAVNQALNCGGSYTVPAGYHSGTGVVRANTLAAQTSATATAARIYTGQTAWVNGAKITGTMTVNSILNFSAATYSTSQILLKWQNPNVANGKPFSGVFVQYSTSGYPGQNGGTRIYTGAGSNLTPGGWSETIVNMPEAGRGYYFSCTPYLVCSAGNVHGNTINGYAATTAHGRQAFTSSGTFIVPSGVRSIDIHCTGGGGCGGVKFFNSDYNPAGGAGGYTSTALSTPVTPGEILDITVGKGSISTAYAGSAVANTNQFVYSGGKSTVSRKTSMLCSADGGYSAYNPYTRGENSSQGGTGGSGGGAGDYYDSENGSSVMTAGNGGSDGSAGWSFSWRNPQLGGKNAGSGQNRTTREFGNSSGTLYAGGGGGGGLLYAAGGDGGGGRGGRTSAPHLPTDGAHGSGGGGGGGSRINNYDSTKGVGGSGNVIIRW